jgi:hypothetical protein
VCTVLHRPRRSEECFFKDLSDAVAMAVELLEEAHGGQVGHRSETPLCAHELVATANVPMPEEDLLFQRRRLSPSHRRSPAKRSPPASTRRVDGAVRIEMVDIISGDSGVGSSLSSAVDIGAGSGGDVMKSQLSTPLLTTRALNRLESPDSPPLLTASASAPADFAAHELKTP